MTTSVTTISNAKLIESARTIYAKDLHDKLSPKIREFFAGLNDRDAENAIVICSIGRNYTIEVPMNSNVFNEKHQYHINNTIRMSHLFQTVKRVTIFYKNGEKYVRIWLRGDIRKFLPKNHKLYHDGKNS